MSIEQIRKLYPEARIPSEKGTLSGGAKCELMLEGLEVQSKPFQVCFFFLDQKLTQVTLKALDPNIPGFESIVDLLRVKYGPELGAGNQLCKRGLLTVCKADWSLPSGTNVSAIFMVVGRNDPIMNINYQTRMAGEASKL